MSVQFRRGASGASAALAAIALALIAGACSKGEPPQAAKPRPNAPLQTPAPRSESPSGNEAVEALKERLTRQEAAARLFEKNVLEPAPPRVPDPPKALAAQPPRTPPPAKSVAPPSPAAVEPAKSALPPPPPPRTEIAAAKPSAPVESSAGVARLVSRVDPEFPAEALRAGVERGSVRARLTLDGDGNVTRVEVVEATPRRVFDRAVVRALSQWKFNPGATGRSVESEVDFKR